VFYCQAMFLQGGYAGFLGFSGIYTTILFIEEGMGSPFIVTIISVGGAEKTLAFNIKNFKLYKTIIYIKIQSKKTEQKNRANKQSKQQSK